MYDHRLAEEFLRAVKPVKKGALMDRFTLYTQGRLLVLLYLCHREGNTIVPSDIAKHTNTSTARITAILNGLEEKGLITRKIDKNDRRKILVGITESGREKAIAAKEEMLDQIGQIFEKMGEEDSADFIRLTQKFFALGQELKEKEGDKE